ncbi:MAG: DNA polymerase III subunit gamma/tau [Desulfobacteraceae bacterium]|nr:DNA polymerase III subunit gamma/tau [Desulfobacteraceae bacterium]
MSYQVLALKYRPQVFEEVIGQDHVTQTLANAISSDRVAHAILLTGPRGTGKTTIARILAKAMNCATGPTPTPCNNCTACTDIISGHAADVFEIDGASNNSVDQIRELRENVTYMPSSATYKIYIIDEVHMLSTAAFNALLKTLEEPPEHVLFIFATTEVHKIPATILSRCQRHDLGRVPLEMISNHLKSLCQKEGFEILKESLDLIALEADGSIRDSLSLLDRVLSAANEKEIDHERVLDGLGVIDRKIMFDIASAIFESNGSILIDLIHQINDLGHDLKKIYTNIILHFRNLNIIKICGIESMSADITDAEKQKIADLVSDISAGHLNMLLKILLDEESLVRYASDTKTAIEMVLLRLVQVNPGAQIDQVIQKLDSLAKKIDKTPQVPQSQASEKKKHIQPESEEAKEPVINADPPKEVLTPPPTWEAFLSRIEKKHPFIFALLSNGIKKEETKDDIILELIQCSALNKSRLESKKNELGKKCKEFFGKNLIINIGLETGNGQNHKNGSDLKKKQTVLHHPLVQEARKLFNGEIINY